MVVVQHPVDPHYEAIQRETLPDGARRDLQCWSWHGELETLSSVYRKTDLCRELGKLIASHAPPSQALPSYLWWFSQDCLKMICDVGSFVDTCDQKALKSFVIDKDGRAWPTLKRLADDLIVPRRRLKRQRIAVHGNESGMLLDNGQLDRGMSMSPRSLQFALPKLTSHDTLCVLHAMHTIPSELRHLNGRASVFRLRQHCKVRKVFGWRHLLCQEEDTGQLARRVVWKSAKALDSMRMRPLARRIWQASTDTCSGSHGLEMGKVVYTVNPSARVVYSTKKPSHCRRARHQVWLECYFDDGLQICVARKELRQFSDYRVPDTCATECEGFLVRPLYTRTISSQLAGCSLHCLRAVDASASGVWAAVDLKQRLIHDLPQLTLQWEEDNIYDLMQVPQVLLDSVFA